MSEIVNQATSIFISFNLNDKFVISLPTIHVEVTFICAFDALIGSSVKVEMLLYGSKMNEVCILLLFGLIDIRQLQMTEVINLKLDRFADDGERSLNLQQFCMQSFFLHYILIKTD